jgi:hypothetical protein
MAQGTFSFGPTGASIDFKSQPLFRSIGVTTVPGARPSTPLWSLVTVDVADQDINEWDACHALVSSGSTIAPASAMPARFSSPKIASSILLDVGGFNAIWRSEHSEEVRPNWPSEGEPSAPNWLVFRTVDQRRPDFVTRKSSRLSWLRKLGTRFRAARGDQMYVCCFCEKDSAGAAQ